MHPKLPPDEKRARHADRAAKRRADPTKRAREAKRKAKRRQEAAASANPPRVGGVAGASPTEERVAIVRATRRRTPRSMMATVEGGGLYDGSSGLIGPADYDEWLAWVRECGAPRKRQRRAA